MKIAFIVGKFPALSETFILNQITILMDLGHDIQIFAHTGQDETKIHRDFTKYALSDRVKYIMKLPANKNLRRLKTLIFTGLNFFKNPALMTRVLKILLSRKEGFSYECLCYMFAFMWEDFDVVHCHFGPLGIVGTFLKHAGLKAKLVVSFHGYDLSKYLVQYGPNVYCELFETADLCLPISDHWRAKLKELGCPAEKIRVHRMGIDLTKFTIKQKATGTSEAIKLLTIGRLTEKKDHETVIRALKKLVDQGKDNFVYQIAGDGPLKDELVSLISEFDLSEYVRFLGSVKQEEAVKLYNDADIFVLVSRTASDGDQEGIPVVLMEAHASGLPVISSYHTGIPEVVLDGKSGFLVPEKDVSALAEKLEYLISNPHTWPEMGRCGHNFVSDRYDINTLGRELESIYENLIAG